MEFHRKGALREEVEVHGGANGADPERGRCRREGRLDLSQAWDQRADVLRMEVQVRRYRGVAATAHEGR